MQEHAHGASHLRQEDPDLSEVHHEHRSARLQASNSCNPTVHSPRGPMRQHQLLCFKCQTCVWFYSAASSHKPTGWWSQPLQPSLVGFYGSGWPSSSTGESNSQQPQLLTQLMEQKRVSLIRVLTEEQTTGNTRLINEHLSPLMHQIVLIMTIKLIMLIKTTETVREADLYPAAHPSTYGDFL